MVELEENIYDNILKYSNTKLCEIIVANRYLGIMRDEAVACMKELAKRRIAGDNFEYEKYIDDTIVNLPKFDLDVAKIINKIPKIL